MNAKYTSKEIQNEIIAVLSDLVREQINDEINESRFFSVAADECKDVSKRE